MGDLSADRRTGALILSIVVGEITHHIRGTSHAILWHWVFEKRNAGNGKIERLGTMLVTLLFGMLDRWGDDGVGLWQDLMGHKPYEEGNNF